MRHIISILVEDKFGALARVVELFTSRGYNLDSICSGEAEIEGTHRITLATGGDDQKIQQIIKLLNNIINVHEVTHLSPSQMISMELVLIRLEITVANRTQVLELIHAYQGTIFEMSQDSVSFQIVGNASRINGATKVFRDFKLIEMSRTGEAAIHR